MKRVCCICGDHFGDKPPLDSDEETGGICPKCEPAERERVRKEIAEHDRLTARMG